MRRNSKIYHIILSLIFLLMFIIIFIFSTSVVKAKIKESSDINSFISISDNWEYSYFKVTKKDFSDPIFIKSDKIDLPVDFKNLLNDSKEPIIRGIVEFKKEVNIDYEFLKDSRFLGLYLGKIIDCSEIYINDNLISRNGIYKNRYFTAWNKNLLIKLPNFLTNNVDKIEIKIKVFYHPEGSIQDTFLFGDYYKLQKIEKINNILDIDLKVVFLLISIILSILFLYISFKLKVKYYFYFTMMAIQISIFSIIYLITDLSIDHSIFNYFFEYKSLYLSFIFLILFVFEYINKKPDIFFIFSIFLATCGLVMDIIIPDRYLRLSISQFFNIFLYFSLIYFVISIIINFIKTKSKESKDILIPLIILFLSLTNDFLAFKYGILLKKFYPPYVSLKYLNIYGFQFFMLLISRKLIQDLLNSFFKLRILTIDLDNISTDLEKKREDLAANVQKLLDEAKESFLSSENLSNTESDFSKIVYNLKEKINEIKNFLIKSSINEGNVSQSTDQLSFMIKNVEDGFSKTNQILEKVISNINQIIEKMKQIESIVEQTSLLSLNSSVVAGKAAEKGKGFSVISDEIRKLSIRSGEFSSNAQEGILNILKTLEETKTRSKEFSKTFNQYIEQFNLLKSLIEENQQNYKLFLSKIEQMDNLINKISTLSDDIEDKARKLFKIAENSQNIKIEG